MVSSQSDDCLKKMFFLITLVCWEAVRQNVMEWDGWTMSLSLSPPHVFEEGLDCHEYFKDKLRRKKKDLYEISQGHMPPSASLYIFKSRTENCMFMCSFAKTAKQILKTLEINLSCSGGQKLNQEASGLCTSPWFSLCWNALKRSVFTLNHTVYRDQHGHISHVKWKCT